MIFWSKNNLTDTEREVLAGLKRGDFLQAIARSTGLTRERVRQIGEAHSVFPQDPVDQRPAAHIALMHEVSETICARIEAGEAPFALSDIYAMYSQHPRAAVQRALEDAEILSLLAAHEVPDKVEWSNDAILAALQHAASQVKDGERLTGEIYDGMLREQWVTGPSRSLIIQRLGSWSTACAMAGISHEKRNRHGTTVEDFWPWLNDYADDQMLLNQSLSFGSYSRWAQEKRLKGTAAPSGSLLKARLFLHMPWHTVRNELIHGLLDRHPGRWARDPAMVAALT